MSKTFDIIPHVDNNNANNSTCETEQTAATPESPPKTSEEIKSAEVEPLEGEDDDEDKGRGCFKGEEIVDKSADLKRVEDDDDHHAKSSPGGPPLQIAVATAEEPKKAEFRCERCAKVYRYPDFLKVHQRRPCA